MKYILLIDKNVVAEIIPEFNPDLPGFTVSERYSPEFVSKLIAVDDDAPVEQNWVYEDGAFVEPKPEPEPSRVEELEPPIDDIAAL